MPGWLTEAVRPRPAPVPWGEMLRAALAICVPLSVGIAVGRRDIGLLPALGGLLGTMIDTGGPYMVRVKRVLTAGVFGGAAGLVVGELIHGRGWIAVAALVVVAGVSAVLSRLGGTGSATGLQLLVYSSLGLGPFGALRPWWHTALGFVVGVAWALLLIVPGWLLSPRSAEQRSVAAVYHALAGYLRAIGTPHAIEARRAVTAALNTAYDTLLTARSTAGGRSRRMTHLMAVLNASHPLSEAATALRREGTRPPPLVGDTIDRLADAIATGAALQSGPRLGRTLLDSLHLDGQRGDGQRGDGQLRSVPPIPPPWSASPGSLALRDAMAGLARAIAWTPDALPEPAARTSLQDRIRGVLGSTLDRLRGGWLGQTFAIRLMICIGVAAATSEVLPLQRSYWVVLTVAIVLKPDYGSAFARALQRGIGTILGAVLLAVVPYGPLLLIPMAVLAAGLPFGRSRNFGLMATFLRAEYQRAMSEPPAVSRRASAWWPAIVGLEEVIDAVTATAVQISRGAPAPAADAVHQLTAVLDAVADAIDAGVPPPRAGELPADEALKPVIHAARPVLELLAPGPQPAEP